MTNLAATPLVQRRLLADDLELANDGILAHPLGPACLAADGRVLLDVLIASRI